MPIADVTYHSNQGDDIPVFGGGGWGPSGVLPPQVGNSQQLDFSGGPANGVAAAEQVTALVISDADCRIAVGEDIAATVANSRRIRAGIPEAFHIPMGARLSVRAA